MDYTKALSLNIPKYYAHRVLSKRVYLPLIAIYAVNVAKLSLFDLGVIAAITALTQLILEIPSGYISDKVGHKKTLVMGAIIVAVSPLAYIIWPNYIGVLLGSALFFAGVAFHSGTIEAFVHETLLELGREKETARVFGLAQTFGLIGNAVLISLVPLTYVIDVKLPFVIGAILLILDLILNMTFTTPIKTHKSVNELESISFKRLLGAMRETNDHLLFLFLGVSTAVAHKIPEFREIYFQDIGVSVSLFGIILATASITGAILSFKIYKINNIFSARSFYLMDLLLISLLTVIIGFTRNPVLGVILFIAFTAYMRSRKAPMQAYLLADCPTRELKATYISLFSFSSSLNGIWVPLILGYAIGAVGVGRGYAVFGVLALIILIFLFTLHGKKTANS